MLGLRQKAATLTFFSVSTLYQAHGSEVVQTPPKQLNVTAPNAGCSQVQPASSTVNNISATDHSVRTANRSNSNSFSNNLTKPLANPTSTSVTVSNSCEPSHFAESGSATSTVLTAALIHLIEKDDQEQQKNSGNAWKALEKFAPVFQTLVWALLIFFLSKRFAQPISEMFRKTGDRLEKVHIKTPFGELFADLHPVPVEKQKINAGEAANVQSSGSDEPVSSSTTSASPESLKAVNSRARFMKMYYEAEDFVIRTLQQEFGTTIAQNMQTGTGIEMDGFFISQDTPHIIEVKLVRSAISFSSLRYSITRLVERLKPERRFRNVRIILAVVTLEKLDQFKKQKFEADLIKIDVAIQVRWFDFSELQRRFVE